MRTFVYSDAKSNKFWNVEVQGNALTVTFGKVGAKGQTQVKTLADEAAAHKEADRLVREKLNKGYRETTAPTAGPAATRRALEEAILDNPEDRAAHAAYADLLSEEGDSQGEFISVQLALEDPGLPAAQRKKLQQREKELLKAHQAEWVGRWAELARDTGPEGRAQVDFPGPKPFRFIRGILAEVTIDELTGRCGRAFVRAPQTRLVRRLFLGGFAWDFDEDEEEDEDEDGDDEKPRAAKAAEEDEGPDEEIPEEYQDQPGRFYLPRWPYFGNLRVFQFGWTSDENYQERCNFQSHLHGREVHELVGRMPRLEELYVFADGVEVGKLFSLKTLTHLRILQLYHNWSYPLEKLAANPAFGRLTHLLLHPKAQGGWVSGNDAYITPEGLRAVVRSPHLKSLTHLRLRLTDFGDAGCEDIVRSGVLKRLKALDLRHGCVSDEGAKALAACPDLKNLELLDLSRNELTDAGVQALRATGVQVRTEHQHGPTVAGAEREYLYEGDYE